MGWGSAGFSIFNPTIEALIEAGATDDVLFKTAVNLINNLRDGDWDTEDESLEHFKSNPVVVRAFAECGIRLSYRTYKRMPDAELQHLRGTYDRTTQLMWSAGGVAPRDSVVLSLDGDSSTFQRTLVVADSASPADLHFIAQAHLFMPKLLDEIDRLRAKLTQEYDETEP